MALDQILAHKREEVAARKEAAPLETFESRLVRSDRSLEAALRRPRTGYVLEVKGASPSQGVIRADLDLDAIVAGYGAHASAISVLTDSRYFGGTLERLAAVRRQVHVPVLCKDFVVDPYQVFEARRHGADAILLMLSVLSDYEYQECRGIADRLGLDVLTEVHTVQELARAQMLDAPIIGINNRDLHTLQVDLAVTEQLAPRVTGDRVVVSESGIRNHADARRLAPLVNGFLVGTSLMAQDDIGFATRALIYGITKVCGLTLPEDAATAHALGATHGGMIFAPESPRRVDLEQAADLRRTAPLRWVGVFVNLPAGDVADLAERLDLSAVQLHGEEPLTMVEELRRRLAGRREVWKAIRVRDAVPRLADTGADRLVLDTFAPGARGGTGRRFDWPLLRDHPDLDRILLGGGLTADAIPAAEQVGCWGLDVSSGVERAPGQKDPIRLAAFLDARRGRGRSPGAAT